jgi:hypothetical protein
MVRQCAVGGGTGRAAHVAGEVVGGESERQLGQRLLVSDRPTSSAPSLLSSLLVAAPLPMRTDLNCKNYKFTFPLISKKRWSGYLGSFIAFFISDLAVYCAILLFSLKLFFGLFCNLTEISWAGRTKLVAGTRVHHRTRHDTTRHDTQHDTTRHDTTRHDTTRPTTWVSAHS